MLSKNKIVMGNKILLPCLDVIMIAFELIQYGRRIGKKVYCAQDGKLFQSLNVICIFSKASRRGLGTALK